MRQKEKKKCDPPPPFLLSEQCVLLLWKKKKKKKSASCRVTVSALTTLLLPPSVLSLVTHSFWLSFALQGRYIFHLSTVIQDSHVEIYCALQEAAARCKQEIILLLNLRGTKLKRRKKSPCLPWSVWKVKHLWCQLFQRIFISCHQTNSHKIKHNLCESRTCPLLSC